MKSIIGYIIAVSSVCFSAAAYCETWDTTGDDAKACAMRSDDPCEITEKTKYGELKISDTSPGSGEYKISGSGKELSIIGGDSIVIVKTFSIEKKELVLISLDRGGMACPFDFYIAEFDESGTATLSEEFGTCSSDYKAYLKGATLVIKSPGYFNPMHMDEVSKQEVKKITKRVVTFKWVGSKLVK